jgi:hypothetical protein
MPTFIKTRSFSTQSTFNAPKDDKEVNDAIQELVSKGAAVQEIRMELASSRGSTNVQYMILYDAPAPL